MKDYPRSMKKIYGLIMIVKEVGNYYINRNSNSDIMFVKIR
jgi:hypothetical protein